MTTSPRPGDAAAPSQARDLLRAVGCVAFVLAAGVLEVVGGYGANSPSPSWAKAVFPIGWPQAVRVGWWLTVALAAFGYRTYLGRAGFRTRRPVTALVVVPFMIFAVGVAVGAEWATWH